MHLLSFLGGVENIRRNSGGARQMGQKGVYKPIREKERGGILGLEGKRKRGKERKKGRENRTHRGGTLAWGTATCCSSFLPFLQETQREGKKMRGDEKEQKSTFHLYLWER